MKMKAIGPKRTRVPVASFGSVNGSEWTVPKYRSNSVYTSSYKRHRTAQYEEQYSAVEQSSWSLDTDESTRSAQVE